MKFALLASGSKGNCCIVKHNSSSLIIDCGTTKKYLKGCFEQLSYDPMKADALLKDPAIGQLGSYYYMILGEDNEKVVHYIQKYK